MWWSIIDRSERVTFNLYWFKEDVSLIPAKDFAKSSKKRIFELSSLTLNMTLLKS